ncbi:MAG: nucleoside 2-deoxyribosyltransferase [Candidatus Dadabacteria bacterium]|nr:nucleoside 2-deoxyribosyltransferase [Candidatus Dadabacteria bacterium]NIS07364.1 nucleoside 2-deoxyribosyltransferase [Candidatus Dadabacteria bacterium]NIV41308.1 nucleoside 2-deoxyribosyltransferase [Candidatus Dadabacteria bacterium]NIX14543.1 nucleoside 2-deoxyribosyltransferase [Candidatus Dadabacteria bacterium]NIY21001.1 nucleoside 2-deoxyribosyltransferase [Candidatus Dadabacteria bacterium]
MNKKTKIYLAGPLGFSEAGREFHNNSIIPLIKKLGLSFYDPWNTKLNKKISEVGALEYGKRKRNQWHKLNSEIGKLNASEIYSSDIMLAVLDGTDVDSGTAAEIGYAFAKGKTIIGYRGDFRLSADNEGSTVNIQVEYFIRASGGTIITSIKQLKSALSKLVNS